MRDITDARERVLEAPLLPQPVVHMLHLPTQDSNNSPLVQVGNGIELEAVGLQFEPYRWRPCGVTWDSSSRGNKAAANLRPPPSQRRPRNKGRRRSDSDSWYLR